MASFWDLVCNQKQHRLQLNALQEYKKWQKEIVAEVHA